MPSVGSLVRPVCARSLLCPSWSAPSPAQPACCVVPRPGSRVSVSPRLPRCSCCDPRSSPGGWSEFYLIIPCSPIQIPLAATRPLLSCGGLWTRGSHLPPSLRPQLAWGTFGAAPRVTLDLSGVVPRDRKEHRPWTEEETRALVDGVERCGGGKWAEIKVRRGQGVAWRVGAGQSPRRAVDGARDGGVALSLRVRARHEVCRGHHRPCHLLEALGQSSCPPLVAVTVSVCWQQLQASHACCIPHSSPRDALVRCCHLPAPTASAETGPGSAGGSLPRRPERQVAQHGARGGGERGSGQKTGRASRRRPAEGAGAGPGAPAQVGRRRAPDRGRIQAVRIEGGEPDEREDTGSRG